MEISLDIECEQLLLNSIKNIVFFKWLGPEDH